MKYSDKDMATLISEVETQFAEHLAKAEKENKADIKKSEDVAVEAAESGAVSEATGEDNSAEVQKSEQDEAPTVNTEALEYDAEDIAEMDKLYSGMTKSEAELHYASVKRAVFGDSEEEVTEVKKSEVEAKEQKEEKIEKSEKEEVVVDVKKAEVKEEDSIAKSEYEALQDKIEKSEKENEELKKSLEGLTSALGKFLKGSKAPKQKAITRIEYIKKSEIENTQEDENQVDVSKLSKNEISKILTKNLRSGKITKNEDREAINSYYEDNTSVETIKHLL